MQRVCLRHATDNRVQPALHWLILCDDCCFGLCTCGSSSAFPSSRSFLMLESASNVCCTICETSRVAVNLVLLNNISIFNALSPRNVIAGTRRTDSFLGLSFSDKVFISISFT